MTVISHQIETINRDSNYNKEQNKFWSWKINQITYSFEGLNIRFELAEKRISKFEDKSIEVIQSEKQIKINEDKWINPHKPVLYHKVFQHMHSGSLERRRKRERDSKYIWRNNGYKLPIFDGTHDYTHARSSVNS